jgi:hypothetical protein
VLGQDLNISNLYNQHAKKYDDWHCVDGTMEAGSYDYKTDSWGSDACVCNDNGGVFPCIDVGYSRCSLDSASDCNPYKKCTNWPDVKTPINRNLTLDFKIISLTDFTTQPESNVMSFTIETEPLNMIPFSSYDNRLFVLLTKDNISTAYDASKEICDYEIDRSNSIINRTDVSVANTSECFDFKGYSVTGGANATLDFYITVVRCNDCGKNTETGFFNNFKPSCMYDPGSSEYLGNTSCNSSFCDVARSEKITITMNTTQGDAVDFNISSFSYDNIFKRAGDGNDAFGYVLNETFTVSATGYEQKGALKTQVSFINNTLYRPVVKTVDSSNQEAAVDVFNGKETELAVGSRSRMATAIKDGDGDPRMQGDYKDDVTFLDYRDYTLLPQISPTGCELTLSNSSKFNLSTCMELGSTDGSPNGDCDVMFSVLDWNKTRENVKGGLGSMILGIAKSIFLGDYPLVATRVSGQHILMFDMHVLDSNAAHFGKNPEHCSTGYCALACYFSVCPALDKYIEAKSINGETFVECNGDGRRRRILLATTTQDEQLTSPSTFRLARRSYIDSLAVSSKRQEEKNAPKPVIAATVVGAVSALVVVLSLLFVKHRKGIVVRSVHIKVHPHFDDSRKQATGENSCE